MAAEQPITADRFEVLIDGVPIATFSELQGIRTAIDVVDYMESAEKDMKLMKLPGKRTPPTVQLKRGKTNSMELWAWHEAVMQGNMDLARKSASLVMYDSTGKPVARYYMENAWISQFEVSGMRAGGNQVLTESVTIVCEHLQRVAP